MGYAVAVKSLVAVRLARQVLTIGVTTIERKFGSGSRTFQHKRSSHENATNLRFNLHDIHAGSLGCG